MNKQTQAEEALFAASKVKHCVPSSVFIKSPKSLIAFSGIFSLSYLVNLYMKLGSFKIF